MVFVNGCVFLLLSLSGVRERIVGAHPLLAEARHHRRHRPLHRLHRPPQRRRRRGQPGHVRHPRRLHVAAPTALCLVGLALTVVLVARRVPGAIVLGIAVTTRRRASLCPTARGGTVTALAGSAGVGCRRRRRRCCCSWTSLPHQRAGVLQGAAAHPHAAAGGHVRQHRHADRRGQARRAARRRRPRCRARAACWWPIRWRRS